MNLGIQIFGCLKECYRDPKAFFDRLADAGYTQIEPCVAFGAEKLETEEDSILHYIWTPKQLMEYLPLMQARNLTLSSCHIFSPNPLSGVEEMVETAKVSGIKQYVMNVPQDILPKRIEEFSLLCKEMAIKLKEHGLELWLHNNYQEIACQQNGQTAYEMILKACEGYMGAQVDVGWVLYGGVDPMKFLEKNEMFIRSIHYKDVKGNLDEISVENSNCCLGNGKLEYKSIYQWAKNREQITQLIDQDVSETDLIKDLEISAARYFQQK